MKTIDRITNVNLNKKKILVGCITVLVILGIYAVFISNKTMPLAEGWYDYYANQMLQGKSVYKDFEYLFTPIYITLMTGFVSIFGESIILFRVLGIIIYLLIAIIIYLIATRIFSVKASVIATITGMFYMQSEVYTVFYDYVRVMDIFSYLSVLFMVCTIRKWCDNKNASIYYILWSIFSSLFVLVKQNMGLLLTVFSLLLIISSLIYLRKSLKEILIKLSLYLIIWIIPIAIIVLIIYFTSDLNLFIQSTIFGAASAKGGIFAILFNWIINGVPMFGLYFIEAIVLTIFLVFNYRMSKNSNNLYAKYSRIFFIISMVLLFLIILIMINSRSLSEYFAARTAISPYLLVPLSIFLIIIIFVILLRDYFIKSFKHKNFLAVLAILGSFFTISFGAGTSGGLSIGESVLGITVLVCLFYDSAKYKLNFFVHGLIIIFCIVLSLRSIAYKLIYPCNWWGIDTSSTFEATELTNIDKLKGIYVSKSEKEQYEGVVETILKYSDENDSIYCFPAIPIFYNLSERNDPGVYAKVQWFDIATHDSIVNDIEVLKRAKPKVIVILNLNETTYEGHENGFNLGVSGTRKMRDFLYEFAYTNSYKYIDNYISTNNNLTVFVLDEEIDLVEETGTKENPILINSKQDLVNASMRMNMNTANKKYYKLTSNIDLNGVMWIPFGYYNDNNETYINMNGYEITNINTDPNRLNLGTDLVMSKNQ